MSPPRAPHVLPSPAEPRPVPATMTPPDAHGHELKAVDLTQSISHNEHDATQFQFDGAKMEYDAKIKTFKDVHAAKRKLIEQEALAAGKAKKVPSYYASFEGEPAGKEEES